MTCFVRRDKLTKDAIDNVPISKDQQLDDWEKTPHTHERIALGMPNAPHAASDRHHVRETKTPAQQEMQPTSSIGNSTHRHPRHSTLKDKPHKMQRRGHHTKDTHNSLTAHTVSKVAGSRIYSLEAWRKEAHPHEQRALGIPTSPNANGYDDSSKSRSDEEMSEGSHDEDYLRSRRG